VLCHARAEGLIDAARLDALHREGAKGIVQLAAHFSTANLRPALEAARTRLVTLVGLALEAESGGKLDVAARLLRDKTLLALSKAGADRLRRLHALPTERLLGAPRSSARAKEFLDQCTSEPVITYARYLAEHAARERNQHYIDAAYWLAERFGVGRADAQDWHVFCESVINSALLVLFTEKNPAASSASTASPSSPTPPARSAAPASACSTPGWPTPRRPSAGSSSANARASAPRSCPSCATPRPPRSTATRTASPACSSSTPTPSARSPTTTRPAPKSGKNHRHPGRARGRAVRRAPDGRLRPRTRPQPAQERRAGHLGRLQRRGFDDAAVARFIDNVVPFEYQADIRRMWDDDLGPEARVHLDSDDEARVLDYLQETCRASWKKRAS
jgi:hypothetical protein